MATKLLKQSEHDWLYNNSVIAQALPHLINIIENKGVSSFEVNEYTLPDLFTPISLNKTQQKSQTTTSNTTVKQRWELFVDILEHQHQVIQSQIDITQATEEQPFMGALIFVNANKEKTVRRWFSRLRYHRYEQEWTECLQNNLASFPVPKALSTPIHYPGMTAKEIILGFISLSHELANLAQQQQLMSLRTLSARCFNGDSKFLDNRRSLLDNVYFDTAKQIQARVIMMSVYIPKQLNSAIFVENFDSFRSTVAAVKKSKLIHTTAVVYSAGYRASASLIRQSENTQFVTINHVNSATYSAFSDWWFSKKQHVAVYFWGDLDFDGMGILKSLRGQFTNAQAFKPAYRKIMHYHQNGIRYKPKHKANAGQTDPGITGCEFVDTQLLPLLRKEGFYTDQEVLCETEIVDSLNQLT